MAQIDQKLYIIRHGNTFDKGDVVTRVGGRTDLRLSTSGKEQAKALGEHFAGSGVHFDRLVAGPLLRTRETASMIGARLGQAITIEIEEGFREIDYGPDENQPEEAVIARIGVDALAAWESSATVPNGWKVDVQAQIKFWQAVLEFWQQTGETQAIVTSNGVARFVLLAMGLSQTNLKLRTGSYGIINLENGAPTLEAWDLRP
jgi:probable phosphoglycerate mutase